MEKKSKTELLAELTEAKTRITALNEQYEGQYMDPESEDGTTWNGLNARVDQITQIVKQQEVREQRVAELAKDPKNTSEGFSFLTAPPGSVRGQDIYDLSTVRVSMSDPQSARGELHDRAMKAIDVARFPHEKADQARCQEQIERILATVDNDGSVARRVLATGSPTYKKAFAAYLSGGHLTPEFSAALSLGTDSAGGFAVPFELDPTLIPTSNGAVNPYRNISRVAQITGKEWDGVTAGAVTAHRRAEGTEVADDSPTLSQPTVRVSRVDVFIPFSIELQQDWNNLQGEMAMLIQDAKDVEEATSFTTGNGTAPNPQGILTGATVSVNTAATATFASADLDTAEDNLPPRYQPNAQWLGSRTTYNRVRHFATNDGPDLWVRIAEPLAHGGNTGRTLLGYRANECSAMPTVLTSATQILVFGDFSRFLIVDKIGLNIELVPHLFGAANRYPTGQRGFLAFWRNSCKVLDANGFRVLKTL